MDGDAARVGVMIVDPMRTSGRDDTAIDVPRPSSAPASGAAADVAAVEGAAAEVAEATFASVHLGGGCAANGPDFPAEWGHQSTTKTQHGQQNIFRATAAYHGGNGASSQAASTCRRASLPRSPRISGGLV